MYPRADDLSDAAWFKSSYSNDQGGNCVECAPLVDGSVAVRDSKVPHGSAFVFTNLAWSAFTSALPDL